MKTLWISQDFMTFVIKLLFPLVSATLWVLHGLSQEKFAMCLGIKLSEQVPHLVEEAMYSFSILLTVMIFYMVPNGGSNPQRVLQRIFLHKLEVDMKKEGRASQLVALPWVTKNVEAMDYI